MSVEEAAKYVAAAYAVILAALAAWTIWSARRVNALQREVRLLAEEIERRGAGGGGA